MEKITKSSVVLFMPRTYDIPSGDLANNFGRFELTAQQNPHIDYVHKDFEIGTNRPLLQLISLLSPRERRNIESVLRGFLARNDLIRDLYKKSLDDQFEDIANRKEEDNVFRYLFEMPKTRLFDGLHESYKTPHESRIGLVQSVDITLLGIRRPTFNELHEITRDKISEALQKIS